MGEDTRQIAQEIRAERHELGRNLDELQQQAKALTDWRTHYRRHAGPTLAVAFSGGVILGLLASGSSSNRSRRRLVPADYVSPEPAMPPQDPQTLKPRKLAALKTLADNPRARRQVGDAWDHMLEALIGVASAKAIDLIANVVPGFRDEYRARTTDRPSQADIPRPASVSPRM